MNSSFITTFLLGLALVCLCTANIRPADQFNATQDATRLRQAITGSNEGAINRLLTSRSGEQRVAIAQAYNSEYKRNLVDDFKLELSGDYKDLMVAMVTPLYEYYANELYLDAHVFQPDSKACLDIVATASNAELKAIDDTFRQLKLHSHFNMPEALSVVFQGISDRMLDAIFKGERNETQEVGVKAAIADAKLIHDTGEGTSTYAKGWTANRKIQKIFITNSYKQLRQIIKEYQTLYGHGMEKAFKDRGFEEDVEREVLNLIPIINSISDYFATRLYDTMHGIGTDDRSLIRILVSRSEIDLDEIKIAFHIKYGYSLASMVQDDTSGEYQRALLNIVRAY